eukprot:SAG11_NODE_4331_length_1947_cov_1.258798_2_plen_52_part_01
MSSVIQKYDAAYVALKSMSDEPLGECYEMLLARRSALLETARRQVERTNWCA